MIYVGRESDEAQMVVTMRCWDKTLDTYLYEKDGQRNDRAHSRTCLNDGKDLISHYLKLGVWETRTTSVASADVSGPLCGSEWLDSHFRAQPSRPTAVPSGGGGSLIRI
jgi:hypothetical protein